MIKIADYGVDFLDEKLSGIFDKELIIIGAATGVGKSSLANFIAFNNANNGIKPVLFSLENSAGDTLNKEAWKIWKQINNSYYTTYREWCILMAEKKYEQDFCVKKAKESMSNMLLIERNNKGYTLDMLKIDLERAIRDEGCKLAIVDHADYFSQPDNEINENKHIKKVMDTIRVLQDTYGIPIIAFSQFRKGITRDVIIPSHEELYGSSEKAKTATTVIILARDYESEAIDCNYPTFVSIRKDRFGQNFHARLAFDSKKCCYSKSYQELNVNYWGTEIKEIS